MYPLDRSISVIALSVVAAVTVGLVLSFGGAGDRGFAAAPQADLLKPTGYAQLISYQPLPEMQDGAT